MSAAPDPNTQTARDPDEPPVRKPSEAGIKTGTQSDPYPSRNEVPDEGEPAAE